MVMQVLHLDTYSADEKDFEPVIMSRLTKIPEFGWIFLVKLKMGLPF